MAGFGDLVDGGKDAEAGLAVRTRDAIDHPDTARRQAEVDALRAQTGDRHALQQSLLPFRHLLPEHLRGDNARLAPADTVQPNEAKQ